MPQAFDEDPVEAFKRCVWISPFHEDDIGRADRRHRRRPHPVRLRLPAPRGPGRAVLVRRPPAPGPVRRRRRRDHGRATSPTSCACRRPRPPRVTLVLGVVATAAILGALALEPTGRTATAPATPRWATASCSAASCWARRWWRRPPATTASCRRPCTPCSPAARRPRRRSRSRSSRSTPGAPSPAAPSRSRRATACCTKSLVLLTADEPDFIRHAEPAPALAPPARRSTTTGRGRCASMGDVDIARSRRRRPRRARRVDPLRRRARRPAARPGAARLRHRRLPHRHRHAARTTGVGQAQAHRTLSTGVITPHADVPRAGDGGRLAAAAPPQPVRGPGPHLRPAPTCSAPTGALVASFVQDAMIRPMATDSRSKL